MFASSEIFTIDGFFFILSMDELLVMKNGWMKYP